jgi:hypothetical protein
VSITVVVLSVVGVTRALDTSDRVKLVVEWVLGVSEAVKVSARSAVVTLVAVPVSL